LKKIDWTKYDVKAPWELLPEDLATPDPASQPKWKIPEKVAIQCAISGGGSHLSKKENPNHPGNLDEILASAEEVIKEGATLVHFDHMVHACHTKDGKEIPVDESYTYVVKPLLEKYGREKLCPHINILRGTFQQQMAPVVNGIAEISYMTPRFSQNWIRSTAEVLNEYNVKAEIVIHINPEIDFADRVLFRTGLMKPPCLWIILPAAPSRPDFFSEYMPNERAMCRRLVSIVEEIKMFDPGAFIVVCCSGRASKYLITLAMLLGIHVRVGMEDTVWRYPHKDEMIKSNAQEVREATEIAKMLGREKMTPNEYREAIGLKPRFDYLPEGMK